MKRGEEVRAQVVLAFSKANADNLSVTNQIRSPVLYDTGTVQPKDKCVRYLIVRQIRTAKAFAEKRNSRRYLLYSYCYYSIFDLISQYKTTNFVQHFPNGYTLVTQPRKHAQTAERGERGERGRDIENGGALELAFKHRIRAAV